MRDKVLTRAIIISAAVHLVAICVIGRTSGTRLNASVVKPVQQHLMNVDLVKDPYADPPKPKPVAAPPKPDTPAPVPKKGFFANIAAKVFGPPRSAPAPSPARATTKAGGALNTGTLDRHGDIGVRNGGTSVGTVPGADNGRGNGPGTEAGVNHTDPPVPTPKPEYVQPTPPPPPPPPPPQPKKVTRTVCEASGMLAGEHCKNTRSATFNEGDEPRHTCNKCKAPEPPPPPVLADRAYPLIQHDAQPRVPDSMEDGEVLQTEIEYYVDADGSVSDVRVIRPSGNREFDRNVVSAASRWRYRPAVQDGVARRVKMTRKLTVR